MAIVWAGLFMSSVLCTCSQLIYVNKDSDCASNGETMVRIKKILMDQRRIQVSVDRLAVNNDGKALVNDIDSLRQSLASTKSVVTTLQQTIETSEADVNITALQQMVETLQIQVDSLGQNNTLPLKLETLQRQVETLTRDNASQRRVETLQKEVACLKQENKRITMNQKKIQELGEMLNKLKENQTGIPEDVQIVMEGFILHTDCMDLYLNGHRESGVYSIYPFGNDSKTVYCDMVTECGGWTAIQRRLSGSTSFTRSWAEYKEGFGNADYSYWIGNDVIHQLTKRNNSALYVSITLRNGTTMYERYTQFSVSGESDNYRLYLGGPSTGTLDTGDSWGDLSGMEFSTHDRDNDRRSEVGCAIYLGGGSGWWYNACNSANLNGPWYPELWRKPWFPPLEYGSDITETLKMIRPN